MTKREIELKLEIAPEDIPRLKRHRSVQTLKAAPPTSRKITTVYFDTPDFALHGAGLCLRVRRTGHKFVQTLKTQPGGSGGLFRRLEHAVEIGGPVPYLPPLFGTEVGALLEEKATEIEAIFETSVTRASYHLSCDAFTVEVDIDLGEVKTPAGTLPISEVELELVRGKAASLYRLALDLQATIPLRPATLSKPGQGYDLLTGARPQPVKSGSPALPSGITVGEAFQAIARDCLNQLLCNEPSLTGSGDPEALHQMRVAIRRLRSAFALFRPLLKGGDFKEIRTEVRWLSKCLGPARDMDVFAEEILQPVLAEHPGDEGLMQLLALFTRKRKKANRVALEAVACDRFARLILLLGAWMEGGEWLMPATPERRGLMNGSAKYFADGLLESEHQRILSIGKDFDDLSPHQRHELRIDVKRQRYAAGFFQDLYAKKKARPHIASLADLQDQLGVLNDVAVAETLLAPHGKGRYGAAKAWGAGLVLGHHAARCNGLEKRVAKVWKRFKKHPPFWGKD